MIGILVANRSRPPPRRRNTGTATVDAGLVHRIVGCPPSTRIEIMQLFASRAPSSDFQPQFVRWMTAFNHRMYARWRARLVGTCHVASCRVALAATSRDAVTYYISVTITCRRLDIISGMTKQYRILDISGGGRGGVWGGGSTPQQFYFIF